MRDLFLGQSYAYDIYIECANRCALFPATGSHSDNREMDCNLPKLSNK